MVPETVEVLDSKGKEYNDSGNVQLQHLLIQTVTTIQNNLIVLLPFILILLRLLVMRVAGERPDEYLRNLLNVPVDVSFAAIGIVLSALHEDFPGFGQRFGAHSGGVGTVLVITIAIVVLVFTFINRFLDKLGKNFLIAVRDIRKEIDNPGFGSAGSRMGGRLFWAFHYVTGLVLFWGAEIVVSYLLLRFVAGSVV